MSQINGHWWDDKGTRYLFRFNVVGFFAIVITTVSYDITVPYYGHQTTIILGAIAGCLIAIFLQFLVLKIKNRKLEN